MENDQRLIDSGIKGLTFAVPRLGIHSRPSIFEALGIAGAYNLGKALAEKGAHVVLAVRNTDKGNDAAARIADASPGGVA